MIDLMPRIGGEPLPEPGRRHVDHVCIGIEGKNIHAVVDYLKSKGVEVIYTIGMKLPRISKNHLSLWIYHHPSIQSMKLEGHAY